MIIMKVENSRLLHLISELERAGASRAVVSEVLSQAGLNRQDVNASSGSYDYQKEVLFVRKACDALDDITFGLSRRRVTLSTAGVVPRIDNLAMDCPVSLAISLHAVTDELRDQLVPINRKYPISQLLGACERYLENDTRRRITFEYVMLDGVNDSVEDARRLATLLKNIPSKINLMPFNTVPGIAYKRSGTNAINRFRSELMRLGLTTITRRTRGADIAAACGQLAGEVQDRTHRSAKLAAAQ